MSAPLPPQVRLLTSIRDVPWLDALESAGGAFEPGAGGEHKLVRGFEPTLTYSAHWVRRFLESGRAAIQQGLPQRQRETGFKDA